MADMETSGSAPKIAAAASPTIRREASSSNEEQKNDEASDHKSSSSEHLDCKSSDDKSSSKDKSAIKKEKESDGKSSNNPGCGNKTSGVKDSASESHDGNSDAKNKSTSEEAESGKKSPNWSGSSGTSHDVNSDFDEKSRDGKSKSGVNGKPSSGWNSTNDNSNSGFNPGSDRKNNVAKYPVSDSEGKTGSKIKPANGEVEHNGQSSHKPESNSISQGFHLGSDEKSSGGKSASDGKSQSGETKPEANSKLGSVRKLPGDNSSSKTHGNPNLDEKPQGGKSVLDENSHDVKSGSDGESNNRQASLPHSVPLVLFTNHPPPKIEIPPKTSTPDLSTSKNDPSSDLSLEKQSKSTENESSQPLSPEANVGGEDLAELQSVTMASEDEPKPELSITSTKPEDSNTSTSSDPITDDLQPTELESKLENTSPATGGIPLADDSSQSMDKPPVISAQQQMSASSSGANSTARALTLTFSIVGGLIIFAMIIYIIRMCLRNRRLGKAESPPPSPELDNMNIPPQLDMTRKTSPLGFTHDDSRGFYPYEQRFRQEDMKLNYGLVS